MTFIAEDLAVTTNPDGKFAIKADVPLALQPKTPPGVFSPLPQLTAPSRNLNGLLAV